MPCSRYDLYYGGTAGAGNGVLSAAYYNCGDRTPFNLTVTGGTSGAYYGQVIATTDYGFPALKTYTCLLYTSPSPRDRTRSRMPSSA